jgi:hypothetical protein
MLPALLYKGEDAAPGAAWQSTGSHDPRPWSGYTSTEQIAEQLFLDDNFVSVTFPTVNKEVMAL